MTLDLKRVQAELDVSVPIRGLFNLTEHGLSEEQVAHQLVSVPIRGLFNLTVLMNDWYRLLIPCKFPSPLGDYLI